MFPSLRLVFQNGILQLSIRRPSNGNLDKEPTLKKVESAFICPFTVGGSGRRMCNGDYSFISIIVCFP